MSHLLPRTAAPVYLCGYYNITTDYSVARKNCQKKAKRKPKSGAVSSVFGLVPSATPWDGPYKCPIPTTVLCPPSHPLEISCAELWVWLPSPQFCQTTFFALCVAAQTFLDSTGQFVTVPKQRTEPVLNGRGKTTAGHSGLRVSQYPQPSCAGLPSLERN